MGIVNPSKDQLQQTVDLANERIAALENQLDLSERQRTNLLRSITFRKACNRDANAATERAWRAENALSRLLTVLDNRIDSTGSGEAPCHLTNTEASSWLDGYLAGLEWIKAQLTEPKEGGA